ncbi:MAG: LamB/YcsF family protein [Lachnospiraceae bacterium]|jgi:UPF0271 protein|nr:LamB/YcsF family protein [Lachnospiraceae bacterium]
MFQVDINADLGESFGAYKMGMDDKIIPFISSANVATGFHAGDPLVMEKTVKLAKKYGVKVGAHPGFPDLVGFGRRNMKVSPAEVKAMVIYQVGALRTFCIANGVELQHVKPHGAMYNMAGKDVAMSEAIIEAIYEVDKDLILLAPLGSEMINAAKKKGLKVALEVFADRAYEEDGSLVARTKEGSMITDEDLAVSRVIRMIKEGKVETITGKDIDIKANSVCVHGDGEKALAFVEKITEALKKEDIAIKPMGEIVK